MEICGLALRDQLGYRGLTGRRSVNGPSSEQLVKVVAGGLQLIDCCGETGERQGWRRRLVGGTEALLQCHGGSLHFPGSARNAFDGSRFFVFAVGLFHAQRRFYSKVPLGQSLRTGALLA